MLDGEVEQAEHIEVILERAEAVTMIMPSSYLSRNTHNH